MKLYQALKLKNKLVGEIGTLQTTISGKNSSVKGNTNRFDLDDLSNELTDKKNQLIELKVAISNANAPIQKKIYVLSELKASIKFWNGVPTKEGKEVDRWTKEVNEFEVHFDELFILEKKKEIEKQIETIQEELDYFNHVTDIQELVLASIN